MSTIEVTFDATWVTDVATGTSIQLWKTDRAKTDTRDVRVVSYAGGRTRIVSTPRRDRSTPLTFRRVSEANLATLELWAGRLLLLRDPQGWRRWGTYSGVASTTVYPAPHEAVYEVALTFMDVTYAEAVT